MNGGTGFSRLTKAICFCHSEVAPATDGESAFCGKRNVTGSALFDFRLVLAVRKYTTYRCPLSEARQGRGTVAQRESAGIVDASCWKNIGRFLSALCRP